jgi:hypothetical protein
LIDRSRHKRPFVPELNTLEGRLLLSTADLTTAAAVTTITHGVATTQPMRSAYATNADSVRVDFTATDPDDPGVTPTTHFLVADLTTGTTSTGTGSTVSLAAAGEYQVQYWSTDADDSEPAGAHSILVAIDRTAPSITLTASPNILWPPNGKFVTVNVTGTALDTLSGVNPASVRFHVVDEYGRVQPSGQITNLIESMATPFGGFGVVNFSFQISLQARRFGFDFDGRQYRIDVTAQDMAGNVGSGSTSVTVPHDIGQHNGGGQHGHHGFSVARVHTHSTHVKHHESSGAGGAPVNNTPPVSITPLPGGQGKSHGHGHGHGQSSGSSTSPVVTNPIITIGVPTDTGHGHGNGHGDGNGNGGGNGNGNGHGNGGDNGNGNGHGNGNGKPGG